MKVAPILSVAKMLVKEKKIRAVLLGAQFCYMGYTYLKGRKRKRKEKFLKAIKTS